MDSVYSFDFLWGFLGQNGVGGGSERYLLYSNYIREGQRCQVLTVPFFLPRCRISLGV